MKLIAGPCVIEESGNWLLDLASEINEIVSRHSWIQDFYFKASFDKANRTSAKSFRGIGMEAGLNSLWTVLENNIRTITDIHEDWQAPHVYGSVSAIQIPAMLSRQTDLIKSVMSEGLPVNIKRMTTMPPSAMKEVYAKASEFKNYPQQEIWICDRGAHFGYGNLVTDIPAIVEMAKFAPVIFDCTHSVQMPGGQGESSGGRRAMIPFVSRAAASTGMLSGFFMEVHPDPTNAKSDGPCQLPLSQLDTFLTGLGEIVAIS